MANQSIDYFSRFTFNKYHLSDHLFLPNCTMKALKHPQVSINASRYLRILDWRWPGAWVWSGEQVIQALNHPWSSIWFIDLVTFWLWPMKVASVADETFDFTQSQRKMYFFKYSANRQTCCHLVLPDALEFRWTGDDLPLDRYRRLDWRSHFFLLIALSAWAVTLLTESHWHFIYSLNVTHIHLQHQLDIKINVTNSTCETSRQEC